MSDRKLGRQMPQRQHVPWRVYDLINRSTCLHIDAWLYETPDERFVFVFEFSAAGRDILARRAFMVELIGATWDWREVQWTSALQAQCLQRSIDDKRSRRRHPYLETIHRTRALPLINMNPPAPFVGFKSVALWYVHTDRNISDPFAGIVNMYDVTGRAERDASMMTAPQIEPDTPAPKLPPRERSIMRTLDKVLGHSGTNVASERTGNET